MSDKISVRDEVTSEVIDIYYEDILKYHGNEMRGGVALAFKIMMISFSKFLPDIPERGKLSFYSGIGKNGKGIIDAVEMVMRVKTHSKLFLDIDYCSDKNGQEAPNGGRYYFEVGYGNKIVKLYLKEGIVPDEFIHYSRISYKCKKNNVEMEPQDREKLFSIRKYLEDSIMSSAPEDLFVVVE